MNLLFSIVIIAPPDAMDYARSVAAALRNTFGRERIVLAPLPRRSGDGPVIYGGQRKPEKLLVAFITLPPRGISASEAQRLRPVVTQIDVRGLALNRPIAFERLSAPRTFPAVATIAIKGRTALSVAAQIVATLERWQRPAAGFRTRAKLPLRYISIPPPQYLVSMSRGVRAEPPEAAPPPETFFRAATSRSARPPPVSAEPPTAGAEPPPEAGAVAARDGAAPERKDLRFIQAQLKQGRTKVEDVLRVRSAYTARLRVGPAELGWLGPEVQDAGTAFPDDQLPPDAARHTLTITLSEPTHIPQPLVAEVTIGREGPSTVATFKFSTAAKAGPFKARVVIAHKNRVLQTALLEAEVLAARKKPAPAAKLKLNVERVVRPQLQDLDSRVEFAASLTVATTPSGAPAVFALAENRAVLRGMGSIAGKITAINRCLSEVANAPRQYAGGLASPAVAELFRFLADKGTALRRFLVDDQMDATLRDRLRSGNHLQIVTLTPDAFFPAEFIYEFTPPAADATVCPNAIAALKNPARARICTCDDHKTADGSASKHVCPFGFWGVSRVIERHAYHKLGDVPAGDYVLQAEPFAGRRIIELADSALFAASQRVDQEKAGTAKRLHQKLRNVLGMDVGFAQTWQDWLKLVQTRQPHALIVLPHAESVDQFGDTEYSLEIAGDLLKTELISTPYVRPGEQAAAPLVLLLGCDTAVPQSEIDSIVGQFRSAGAGIVVGTVASVLGSHASAVAEAIATQLAACRGAAPVPFGDLLLAARRQALGTGTVMALCVAGFGDADWLIKTR